MIRKQQAALPSEGKQSTPTRDVVAKPPAVKSLTPAQIRQLVRESYHDHKGSYDYLRDK